LEALNFTIYLGEKTYAAVVNKNHETVSVETFPPGMYFVAVKLGVQSMKFVKE
jgi:hypothetical protein